METQRRQRVQELRYMVASGRYVVDPAAVAEAMFERAWRSLAQPPADGWARSGEVLEAR